MCVYDINTKKIKVEIGIFVFIMLFGFWFLYTSFPFVSDVFYLNSKTVSTGASMKYIGIEVPVYNYEVNGVEYSCSYYNSSSNYSLNQNEVIYYSSKDPSKCMTETYRMWYVKRVWLMILMGLGALIYCIVYIVKEYKKLKNIAKLNKCGRLVKNVPCKLEYTGKSYRRHKTLRLVVNYPLDTGITLYSELLYEYQVPDNCDKADIVIDEDNSKNYFVDFEINRIGGNLSSDYYSDNQ